MAAFAGGFIDFPGPLKFVATQQLIDQGRLAHAAGSYQGHGGSFLKIGFQRLQTFFLMGAGNVDMGRGIQRHDFCRRRLVGCAVIEVAFIQQHHGLGSAAADDGKKAFHPPWIEVWPSLRHDHHHIHVGDHHLFLRALACGFAGEPVPSRQARPDHGILIWSAQFQSHPVAHRWQVRIRCGLMIYLAAQHHLYFLKTSLVHMECSIGYFVIPDQAGGHPALSRQ